MHFYTNKKGIQKKEAEGSMSFSDVEETQQRAKKEEKCL